MNILNNLVTIICNNLVRIAITLLFQARHFIIFTLFAWQEGLAKFLAPCVSFIEKELAAGSSVLVHCLAGAHRYLLIFFNIYKQKIITGQAQLVSYA